MADTIVLGGGKQDDSALRAKVRAAVSATDAVKGQTPVGGVVPNRQSPGPLRLPVMAGAVAEQPSGRTQDGGVQPRPPGSPPIRQETREELDALGKALEKQAPEKVADPEEQGDDEQLEMLERLGLRQRGPQDEADSILNNKARRKEIEARLEPLSLEDLIMKGEVRQSIPIIPGRYEIVLRSLTPEESLFIRRQMAQSPKLSDSYALELFFLFQVTCSLVSVNGRELPDHRNRDGEPEDELFKSKMKHIKKMSGYIATDVGVNYHWFDLRMRKLLTAENLGNG